MNNKYLNCCLLILCYLLASCSDDSNKIDDFFNKKVSTLTNIQPPRVVEVYPNAVLFERNSLQNLYRCHMSKSKQDLEANTFGNRSIGSNMHVVSLVDGKECIAIENIEPSTKYFYRMAIGNEQTELGTYDYLYTETKEFTTGNVSEGKVIDFKWDSYYNGFLVKIETPFFGISERYPEFGYCYISLSKDRDMTNSIYTRESTSISNSNKKVLEFGYLDANTTYYYYLYGHDGWSHDYKSDIGSFKTPER